MRVEIAQPVFQAPEFFDALDRILDHFLTGRHRWNIDDVDAIKASIWLSVNDRVSRRNIEVLEKCFVAGAQAATNVMHSMQLTIDVTSNPPSRLPPGAAIAYLSSPVVVVVENEESDGAFLNAIISAYGRSDIWFALENHWIELDHAGGYGEIEKRIERYNARNLGPSRLLVLADNDRLFPGHQSQTFTKIHEVCTRLGVPYVMLAKRTIENYLPIGALQRSSHRACYRAFLKLNATQRDHYNMKKGFARSNSGAPKIPVEQMSVFAHVPPKVLDDLCEGFGGEVWRLFQTASDVITADTMNLTCLSSPTELPDLFDRIEGLL